MLALLTPEEMDERTAYYLLSGAGEMRYAISQVLAQIANQMTRLLIARGLTKCSADAFVGAEDYLPANMQRTAKVDRKINANDAACETKLRRALGD